jgi:hypothetical protein
MRATISAIIAAGAVLLPAASSQTAAQDRDTTKPVAQAEQVTIVGCVVRESDYRRARDAGKGGVAGTGVGVGNEFILTNASMAPAPGSSAGAGPVGTSGTTTMAYELTGANEKQAESFVGKRVEISGTLKAAEGSAAKPTGGPTAGEPPAGIDVTSKDLKLRELEVSSVRASTTGTCPAQ